MVEKMSVEEFRKIGSPVSKNKYGNKKTEYKGIIYDSKKEAEYAIELDRRFFASKPSDRVVLVERQVRYPIQIRGAEICSYFADFKVSYADGHEEVVDVKGVRTDVYKIKKKLVKAVYGITIIEI